MTDNRTYQALPWMRGRSGWPDAGWGNVIRFPYPLYPQFAKNQMPIAFPGCSVA